MKIATSATIFSDAIGLRLSVTYSEIDDSTGKVISDNTRVDRVLTDPEVKSLANELISYAQNYIDSTVG